MHNQECNQSNQKDFYWTTEGKEAKDNKEEGGNNDEAHNKEEKPEKGFICA